MPEYSTHIEKELAERVFPVFVAEYYDPLISKYFMTPQQDPGPMVDGVPLSHEEYKALHPDYEIPPQWTPRTVYQTFDLDMSRSFRSTKELIDMLANGVPFKFENRDDMLTSVAIADAFLVLLQQVRNRMPVEDFIELTSNYIHTLKTTRDTLIKIETANGSKNTQHMTVSDFIQFL